MFNRIATPFLGIVVFILGIALLVYTFVVAFSALSQPVSFQNPADVSKYLLELLRNIAHLFVMGCCGTLISIMGIRMYKT